MKKIFATLIVLLTFAAQVEAAEFTRPQLDKIFFDAGQIQTSATLNLDAETFKKNFNARITQILKAATGNDDISAMEHLFLIKEEKIIGATFTRVFGDYRTALVGNLAADGNFNALNFYYTTPENGDESIFTIWLMTAFVKTIAPDVNPQTLMNELTAENSTGTVVKDGVKFSIASDGNLIFVTAIAQ